MQSKKISQLQAFETLSDTDLFELSKNVDGSRVSGYITGEHLKKEIGGGGSDLDLNYDVIERIKPEKGGI